MAVDSVTALRGDVQTYLTSAPASEFYQQPVMVGDRLPGSEHLLWRAEAISVQFVVKFFLDAGQARSRRQFDGQHIFAPTGLAPQPRWYDRYPIGLSRQILVYDWVPGQPWRLELPADVIALAKSIARVHNFRIVDHSRLSPHPINMDFYWRILQPGLHRTIKILHEQRSGPLGDIYAELANRAALQIDAASSYQCEASPVLIHGDFSLENTINHADHPLLLDWEMFGLGDAAQEIAYFLTMHAPSLNTYDQLFVDTYIDACSTPDLAARIALYRQLMPLRSLDFLLQGLYATRSDSEVERSDVDIRFMFDTVLATTEHAMHRFEVQGDAGNAIASLFMRWFPGETTWI